MKYLQSFSPPLTAILDDGSTATWAMLRLGQVASLYKGSWQLGNASTLPLVCLLAFWMMALLEPGAMLALVVTAALCQGGWRVYSAACLVGEHSPPFVAMALSRDLGAF